MNNVDENKQDPDLSLFNFGLEGKAELSTVTVAITIGLFVILSIIFNSPPVGTWIVLTIAYWCLVLLGIWTFANHQMFASITEKELERMNPDLYDRMKDAVQGNFLAKSMFKIFFIKKGKIVPYSKQNDRTIIILGSFIVVTYSLWFVTSLGI